MSVNVPNTRYFALIPCAGHGSRAGTVGPKQYEPIAGRPMVMHTLAAFAAVKRIARTMVVVAQGDGFFTRNFAPVTAAACGGDTRAISVANGLHELRKLGADSRDWVLVHDAARCLITPELIDNLIDACEGDDVGGLLAQKLVDTLKIERDGRVAETLSREDKWQAQTPQMFRIGRLIEAMEQAGDGVTDEASAMEAVGQRALLVPGGPQNFKVTYPADFALAEAVLKSRQR